MENIKLPIAFAFIVDDVGWHNGADDRYKNRPSRSGLPRYHHPDDIRALNAIAKGLGTKIICSLVLGEWDRKNILRGIPNLTYDEAGWDAAAVMDKEYCEKYFEAYEESEYLDSCLHGLLHGLYIDGKLFTERQYYPPMVNERGEKYGFRWHSREKFEQMIDLFLDIYNDWGFKKKITTFVSPCGCWGTPYDEGNITYASVLRERGMLYWANSWGQYDTKLDTVGGLITSKGKDIAPWDAYDVDPQYLPIKTNDFYPYFGAHLTNFIRYNHEDNFVFVDSWIKHYKEQAEQFGCMLARDNAHSCSQSLYEKYAKCERTGNEYVIDLTEVDKQYAIGKDNRFYVSIKNGVAPKSCTSGRITLYETKREFKTYEIERDGSKIVKITV